MLKKGPLITLSLCIGLPLVSALGLAAYMNGAGVLSIEVREHRRGGDDVQIRVPGWVIQPAMELIPGTIGCNIDSDARKWMPVAEALVQQFERSPDAVYVTVDSREEHVRIEKKGHMLLVNVESPDESVKIRVPAPLAKSALRMVARAADRSHHRRGHGLIHHSSDRSGDDESAEL